MALTKTPVNQPTSKEAAGIRNPSAVKVDRNKIKKISRVIIHYDVGFNNSIYIRGNNAGLSWDKGTLLHNEGPDQWVWETDQPFQTCEFKVLINDTHYEQGGNHTLDYEKHLEYTPIFV